jgi:hypothetical protein
VIVYDIIFKDTMMRILRDMKHRNQRTRSVSGERINEETIRMLVREIIAEQAVSKPAPLDKSRLSSTAQGYMNEPAAQGLTPTEKLTYAAARGMSGVDPTAAKYAATHPKEKTPSPKMPPLSAWSDSATPDARKAMEDLSKNIPGPGKTVSPEKLAAQVQKSAGQNGQLAVALAAGSTDKKTADTVGQVARAVADKLPVTKPVATAAAKELEKITPDTVVKALGDAGAEIKPEDVKKGVDGIEKIVSAMKAGASKMK